MEGILLISEILGSLLFCFLGGKLLEHDYASVCLVVKANYSSCWTVSEVDRIVDRKEVILCHCLQGAPIRSLLTKAAAPGTWRPSKTGSPRRRQDAGIKTPNEEGEQQGTPLSLERVTMTLWLLSNMGIINISSKNELSPPSSPHGNVFFHFILCIRHQPLVASGVQRHSERNVLLCSGIITEESLISSVWKCVIKPTLDDTL